MTTQAAAAAPTTTTTANNAGGADGCGGGEGGLGMRGESPGRFWPNFRGHYEGWSRGEEGRCRGC